MTMDQAIDAACARVAPLWPLRRFVAANPFLGFADRPFAEAAETVRRVAGADILPAGDAPPQPSVPTVAQVLDALAQGDRHASRTAFMIDEISKWCAAYFDQGQAAWRLPARKLPPYPAWRQSARYDRNPEAMGINGFRAAVAAMPDDPREAIAAATLSLGVPPLAWTDYLHRALADIAGWAGHARFLSWDAAPGDPAAELVVHLLAIRVAWGHVLFQQRTDQAFKDAWAAAIARAAVPPAEADPGTDGLARLRAQEEAFQRSLFARIRQAAAERPVAADPGPRPVLQAAFCIDTRSEPFRRALEAAGPGIETLGFAGFFGYPIEYVPIGNARGNAQCPVLLKPAFIVCEAVEGATPDEATEILGARLRRRRIAKAWKAFKQSAVSSFTYVEAAGLTFAAKIALNAIGLARPVPDPRRDGLDAGAFRRLAPALEPGRLDGRDTGFAPAQRLAMAEATLRAMSLTRGFAPLVLLVGHGSATVNNPHASGLDCGACGGHTGEANARVAAAILNDPGVRTGLRANGIDIPEGTWFLGALHDTVTDTVRLFGADAAPPALASAVASAAAALKRAGEQSRRTRAPALGTTAGRLRARGRDWSEVRPEWGLAGNAAFVAAPRARTRDADLGGRVFLHSYDWRADQGFRTLRLIMTAPMIVATWINLQYYASAIDNRAFGAGNKALHNVAGLVGVLEGNGGDLRPGLPWQSVHDGARPVHEPLRLTVLIEAPQHAIAAVLAESQPVRDLVENQWLHLFAIADDGTVVRYARQGESQGAWQGQGAWQATTA